MCPFVCATRDTKEIPLADATESQVSPDIGFKTGTIFINLNIYSATTRRPEIIDPCNPTPCGTNAVCNERNRAASCQCLPGLQGDPYVECKPECTINQECPSNLACIQQKCKDPCPGVCGTHASCSVNNHYPICQCDPGYEGDPFSNCYRKTTCKQKLSSSSLFKISLF